MSSLGIIINPTSGRNRRRLKHVRAWTAATARVSREVADIASIREAAMTMLESGVEVIAINGGDGTAQAVLTEVLKWAGPRPEIALLPGGTTNMSANDLNRCRGLRAALERLAAQLSQPAAERRRIARPLLEISAPGFDTQYGLCMSTGAALRGMEHFREHVGAKGLKGELASGISVLRGLTGIARGSGGWDETPVAKVIPEGIAEPWEDQILVIVSTLERLMLGAKPWWGTGDGPIHLTGLRRRPASLLRLAPAMLRGRPNSRLSVANGYRSIEVSCLTVCDVPGFALDGEVFNIPPGAQTAVRATTPLEFLSL